MPARQPGRRVWGERAYPRLEEDQLARLSEFGVSQKISAGQFIFRLGDDKYDLVVIDKGQLEIIKEAGPGYPEEVIATFGPGEFIGELSILTGQFVYLPARAVTDGRIYRIPPGRFRSLMETETALSDILLTAFRARREILMESASHTIEIIGGASSAGCMALRSYLERMALPYSWMDEATPDGLLLMRLASLTAGDLPAVLLPGRTLRNATPGSLAVNLGLSHEKIKDQEIDLAVVGGGPAGLGAAVYGSSEGLGTVLLDAVGPGGQAAASSRIENYLGFPNGISGAELTRLAAVQALKFGSHLYSPSRAVSLQPLADRIRISLSDGTDILARAAIIATGAHYQSLPIARWKYFEGAGIYYAATELEARSCAGRPVAVVGGANSAGQAALFLADKSLAVSIIVRRDNIGARMSSYLVHRLLADPRVTVHTSSEVTALEGEGSLEAIRIRNSATGLESLASCSGLFCFIGATPATAWLNEACAADKDGFIYTDVHIADAYLGPAWKELQRAPIPFETSIPRVFAAGDVRHGSIKRVAAAVGEGASAVSSVHRVIGMSGAVAF
ncbi:MULTISPECIES: cyclic nucleotide-binding domain-containing thioredoxin-disulfide reductase [unclassified Streptomyces]|uniref:FAD-dependent oxidoreductase n=1 Tax=unclassified Streptomyces TaxID=2593676 RepID=UPI0011633ABB|nr:MULTISPECIES: cyclic nucleotide-binding domain-containing thioredoxin-disulfide reductase [unclassified Streptomyces]QDN75825.1 cyclic nucleotide-binding domain-containing protein [Streptomyces sp. S1A1-7]QDN85481.1 cyclic nucleotide-binding domain-containing protein [Streptomyces sp. RLB3-6]QDO06328.1 cyclic nucleotide-binding domain-containing protein [Streptomyces sp. S1D4-23]